MLPRDEYLGRASEFAAKGEQLQQSKLNADKVAAIRSAAVQRENLRAHIRDNLSNAALAKAHGVHLRTVEKVLAEETWGHVQ